MPPLSAAIPEILAPAGDLEKLQTALAYRAEALYLSGPDLSLRSRTTGFAGPQLAQALDLTNARGARAYYCLNLLPQEQHLDRVRARLEELSGLPLQGLIVADPGVVRLARRHLPQVPLHLSTQANTTNSESVRFWRDQGVARVNLARELDLRAVRAIRRDLPDVELEMFVHGAQCMAVSGRCLMSAWCTQRSSNLGECTHPCRFRYRTVGLEEQQRPAEVTWEIEPGMDFDAVLAAEDLCLVTFMPWLCRTGFNALKIEGRTKTAGYLALVLDVYRTARDDHQAGRFRPKRYLAELCRTATRPLGTGFFLPGRRRIYCQPLPEASRRPMLARLLTREAEDLWRVAVKHRWCADTNLLLLEPGLNRTSIPCSDYVLENDLGQRLDRAHSGMTVRLRCDRPELKPHLFLCQG